MTPENAARLVSLLTAKTEKFEPAIASFNALRREDVNLALAMVSSLPARMIVRIKYADEVSNIDTMQDQLAAAIERGLLRHVEQFAAPQRWKVPRAGFLRDMCRLALCECISPKLCWRCDGRGGWINRKGLKVTCDECAGSGEGAHSDRKRARILGIHEASWRQSWRERYRVIQGEIDRYEQIGLRGMARRFG